MVPEIWLGDIVGFKENIVDQYLKVGGSKFIIWYYMLMLFLAMIPIYSMRQTGFIGDTLKWEDLGEAYYVLFIEIYRDLKYLVYLKKPTLTVCLEDSIWITIYRVMLLLLKAIDSLNHSVHRMLFNEKL